MTDTMARKLRMIWELLWWEISATNFAGMPIERRHRLTGNHQHRSYSHGSGWEPGRTPTRW